MVSRAGERQFTRRASGRRGVNTPQIVMLSMPSAAPTRNSLIGGGGVAGSQLNKLFTGAGTTWSFEPEITIPIFTAGQNQGILAKRNLRHFRSSGHCRVRRRPRREC
jgi:hypothetical protein